MVSTCPSTSKSSRPFDNPLLTAPKAPITIGTIVTLMFHSFFNSLARSSYLSFFSHSFSLILWSAGINGINCFISFSTLITLAILLQIINFRFTLLVRIASFFASIESVSGSVLSFHFRHHSHDLMCAISPIYHFKCSKNCVSFHFSFLFLFLFFDLYFWCQYCYLLL